MLLQASSAALAGELLLPSTPPLRPSPSLLAICSYRDQSTAVELAAEQCQLHYQAWASPTQGAAPTMIEKGQAVGASFVAGTPLVVPPGPGYRFQQTAACKEGGGGGGEPACAVAQGDRHRCAGMLERRPSCGARQGGSQARDIRPLLTCQHAPAPVPWCWLVSAFWQRSALGVLQGVA